MTSTDDVVTDLLMIDSVATAVIDAPLEKIDLGTWLTNLTDDEYRQCAVPDHRAAGWSRDGHGRPVSINVEEIGGALLIQHYVAEVLEPHHTRLVSISDIQLPVGWSTLQVIWDITVTALGSDQATFTNTVLVHPTRLLLRGLEAAGLSVDEVTAEQRAAVAKHNALETPSYAKSVERAALAEG